MLITVRHLALVLGLCLTVGCGTRAELPIPIDEARVRFARINEQWAKDQHVLPKEDRFKTASVGDRRREVEFVHGRRLGFFSRLNSLHVGCDFRPVDGTRTRIDLLVYKPTMIGPDKRYENLELDMLDQMRRPTTPLPIFITASTRATLTLPMKDAERRFTLINQQWAQCHRLSPAGRLQDFVVNQRCASEYGHQRGEQADWWTDIRVGCDFYEENEVRTEISLLAYLPQRDGPDRRFPEIEQQMLEEMRTQPAVPSIQRLPVPPEKATR